ncbi:hypothetical protein L596_021335 [Steinernema carpocapsae]|uniref:Uncharacterized protein n=1 Tax=Steinernema carpocapsae TaxID=34508 RepID=A0A4U5MIG3_STECR|nr:hypothetical protein L596_021335 [Steinernema carpocapsae]
METFLFSRVVPSFASFSTHSAMEFVTFNFISKSCELLTSNSRTTLIDAEFTSWEKEAICVQNKLKCFTAIIESEEICCRTIRIVSKSKIPTRVNIKRRAISCELYGDQYNDPEQIEFTRIQSLSILDVKGNETNLAVYQPIIDLAGFDNIDLTIDKTDLRHLDFSGFKPYSVTSLYVTNSRISTGCSFLAVLRQLMTSGVINGFVLIEKIKSPDKIDLSEEICEWMTTPKRTNPIESFSFSISDDCFVGEPYNLVEKMISTWVLATTGQKHSFRLVLTKFLSDAKADKLVNKFQFEDYDQNQETRFKFVYNDRSVTIDHDFQEFLFEAL